jgi:hypothetical protein
MCDFCKSLTKNVRVHSGSQFHILALRALPHLGQVQKIEKPEMKKGATGEHCQGRLPPGEDEDGMLNPRYAPNCSFNICVRTRRMTYI